MSRSESGPPSPGIFRLRPKIQEYAWGSHHAIAELLGQPTPSAEPQAELWMGTHPAAPSEALVGGTWRSLSEVLDAPLPFLFKVLAADQPLSIQTHPDTAQARRGWEREEAWGIDPLARRRNYRDPNPKPEIVYALTDFHVLCGFRPPAAIASSLGALGLDDLPGSAALGMRDASQALAGFLCDLLEAPQETILPWLVRSLAAAEVGREHPDEGERCRWLLRLCEFHPGDRGVLAPLFLEHVVLEPGEGLYTAPGTFHAYLQGCALELMASSDNVLRGGLTQKHVDVPELLSVLRFEPERPVPIVPLAGPGGEEIFTSPKGKLVLQRHRLAAEESTRLDPEAGSLLLCTEGTAHLGGTEASTAGGITPLRLRRGETVFLTPRDHDTPIELRAEDGGATVFQALGRGLSGQDLR